MEYVNVYAQTLPAHRRGFYDMMMAVTEEEPPFDKDIVRKLTTDQIGEQMIQYSGLPTAVQLRDGQRSPRATVSTPFDKIWYLQVYGMAAAFTSRMIETDQSGLIGKAAKQLGTSQWNAYQRSVVGLLDNATSTSFLGPDAKALAATDHPLKNARTSSNLSTAATVSPDMLDQMLADAKAQKTYQNEPWIASGGYRVITGVGPIERKVHQIILSTHRAHEMSNTINNLNKGPTGQTVSATRGNPFLVDPNMVVLIADGKDNPLFCMERGGVKIRHDSNVDFEEIWNSQCDRVVGWTWFWGTQFNLGA